LVFGAVDQGGLDQVSEVRNMKRKLCRIRALGLLAAGGLVLLLPGCNLDGFWNRAQIGFAERLGAFSADVMLNFFEVDSSGDLEFCFGGTGCDEE
jgi:hypothetical protein